MLSSQANSHSRPQQWRVRDRKDSAPETILRTIRPISTIRGPHDRRGEYHPWHHDCTGRRGIRGPGQSKDC